jgi:hypothetical protein
MAGESLKAHTTLGGKPHFTQRVEANAFHLCDEGATGWIGFSLGAP